MVSIVIEMKGDLDMGATLPGKVLRKNEQEAVVCIRERHLTFRTEDVSDNVVKKDAEPTHVKKCGCEPEYKVVEVPVDVLSFAIINKW